MIKQKILLVDDDPISLQVLINCINNHYAFETAVNGLQAWEMVQATPEDFLAVVADRIMPKLHGLQLWEKMQTHAKCKRIPVILLTGEAEKEEQIIAIKAGIFDFLFKPIEEQLLLPVLQRALQLRLSS